MTKTQIIHAIHDNFDEFRSLWADHKSDQGLGALVFIMEDAFSDETEIQYEFWTLGELRNYMQRIQECDEVIYKWLVNAERDGGYPIVIFATGSDPASEKLHFSSVKKPQLL